MFAVAIHLAHAADSEAAAARILSEVLETWDLRRWYYTHHVTFDRTQIGAKSHPLTIGSHDFATAGEEAMLRCFVHEQLHWFVHEAPGLSEAIREAQQEWPDHPTDSPRWGGYLHFPVCALEVESLIELLGEERGLALASANLSYNWIYDTILQNRTWFTEYLVRHDLVLPAEPPAYGPEGEVVHLGPGRPTLHLVTGHPSERRGASALKALYDRFELTRWQWTDVARVDANTSPAPKPTLTFAGTSGTESLGLLCLWLQLQLWWWLDGTAATAQRAAIAELGLQRPSSLVISNAYAIMRDLLSADEVDSAIANSLNRRQFAAARDFWPTVREVLARHDLLVTS